MSRAKRIIVLIAVVLVVGALVTGIAYFSANHQNAATQPGLYLDGKYVESPGSVLSIGSHEISFPEYRHYFLFNRTYFEMYYGDDFWESDPDGDKLYALMQSTEAELTNMYSWLDIAAQEGITLSDEEKAEIRTTMETQKTELGDDWSARLADMFFLDEATYLDVTEKQALAQKATTEYTEKLEKEQGSQIGNEADKEFDSTMLAAKHILLMPDEAAEDQDAAMEEVHEAISSMLEYINASEDPAATFDEMMHEYSQDGGLETNPDGYTFKEGDMVDEFYQGTKALEIGEISEPIKSSYGYHIILRVPLDDATKTQNRENAVTTRLNELMSEKAAEMEESLTKTPGDYYSKIKADSIR